MPAAIPAAAAIGGALISSNGAKKAAQTQADAIAEANKQDPRIEAILHGQNGQGGLLSQFQGLLNTPRSDAATGFTGANADYLKNFGGADLGAVRGAAMQAMQGNGTPDNRAGLNAYAVGNMVNAPSQNNLNLSGSYDSLINGQPGNNQFLTGAIQKGINQSSSAFGNMITDAKAATQDVLGGIRGNSVLAGQYGGSRQGIAEGKAIDSMNTNLARAASQFGQNNTDAAVAAQAGQYNSDRDRQLAATQGLGAQQYGVAQQNAQTRNQAEFMNVGNNYDLGKFNSSLLQNAQLTTNAQNNSSLLGGSGLLSGLLGQVQGTVNANDNWDLARAQGVNSLLAPYLSRNPSGQVAPAANTGAAALGGGLAGLSLGNSLAGMFGQNSSLPSLQTNHAQPITATAQPNSMPINLPFMNNI